MSTPRQEHDIEFGGPATCRVRGLPDVYPGPQKPEGKVNWIQTDPAKGFNLLWRIYGPTQVWYDGGWRPSEIELVN